MADTLVKLNTHIIFHTKSAGIAMRECDLSRVFSYLGGIIRNKGGIAFIVGGMPDHIHILTTLPKTISLSDFVQAIKKDSSKWIKTLSPYYHSFAWQTGYGAFSVSPSQMENAVRYIQRQPEHHQRRSYREELKMFLEAYGVEYDERYAFKE